MLSPTHSLVNEGVNHAALILTTAVAIERNNIQLRFIALFFYLSEALTIQTYIVLECLLNSRMRPFKGRDAVRLLLIPDSGGDVGGFPQVTTTALSCSLLRALWGQTSLFC